MGSSEFCIEVRGETPGKAFKKAVRQALYNHGHSGYTGTIAEKHEDGYLIFKVPSGISPEDYADTLMREEQSIQSKYDPCGCIRIERGKYLFFWNSINLERLNYGCRFYLLYVNVGC